MPNIEALTQLRRVVEAAPEELFHMRAVVEHVDCGTRRCALGWAIIECGYAYAVQWPLGHCTVEFRKPSLRDQRMRVIECSDGREVLA